MELKIHILPRNRDILSFLRVPMTDIPLRSGWSVEEPDQWGATRTSYDGSTLRQLTFERVDGELKLRTSFEVQTDPSLSQVQRLGFHAVDEEAAESIETLRVICESVSS